MATYAIQINERTVWGKGLVEYLKSLPVHLTLTMPKRKSGLDKALEEVKQGRVYHAANTDDMFSQILGNDYVQH